MIIPEPWELINAGGISYASYRIALLMEELVRYEPDLFIIYKTVEGHRQLALAVMEQLAKAKLVSPPANWDFSGIEQVRRSVIESLSADDHAVALCTVAKVLAWAGKYQEAYLISKRAA